MIKPSRKTFLKMRKPIIHGPYVKQKTYRKRLDELNTSKLAYLGLQQQLGRIELALKNYYTTHNRKFRCDCGHCIYARKLVNLPTHRETLSDLLQEKEIAEKWFQGEQ